MGAMPRTTKSTQPPDPSSTYPALFFGGRLVAGIPSRDPDRLKVVLVRSGHGEVHTATAAFPVRAGDLVLIPPNLEYGGIIHEAGDVVGAAFDVMFVLDQVKWALGGKPHDRRRAYERFRNTVPTVRAVHPSKRIWTELDRDLRRLLARAGHATLLDNVLAAAGLIWRLGALVDSDAATQPVLHDATVARPLRIEVSKAIELLRSDLQHRWTATELARLVNLSESALTRAFRKELGMTTREYLQVVRLVQFEQLVRHSDVELADAAAMVGWLSSGHARRTFREIVGASPQEYRAQVRAGMVRLQLQEVWGPGEVG